MHQTRAMAGYLLVEKVDKAGRKKEVKDCIIPSYGSHSVSEMERMLAITAKENGISENKMCIVPYEHDEIPRTTVNPRHRTDYTSRHWSGWGEGTLRVTLAQGPIPSSRDDSESAILCPPETGGREKESNE